MHPPVSGRGADGASSRSSAFFCTRRRSTPLLAFSHHGLISRGGLPAPIRWGAGVDGIFFLKFQPPRGVSELAIVLFWLEASVKSIILARSTHGTLRKETFWLRPRILVLPPPIPPPSRRKNGFPKNPPPVPHSGSEAGIGTVYIAREIWGEIKREVSGATIDRVERSMNKLYSRKCALLPQSLYLPYSSSTYSSTRVMALSQVEIRIQCSDPRFPHPVALRLTGRRITKKDLNEIQR
ncbi:hypothetical protein CEXT_191271 [Caerostris extrusa]|uniref:Ribosomal protein S10 n=1 Tax=Caerostris extrusa TaxID=172846 RepID=A0AAV4WLN0_CAEEX|nr:hypothetical protein CEXT_191271 [Caerostris extrusa]